MEKHRNITITPSHNLGMQRWCCGLEDQVRRMAHSGFAGLRLKRPKAVKIDRANPPWTIYQPSEPISHAL